MNSPGGQIWAHVPVSPALAGSQRPLRILSGGHGWQVPPPQSRSVSAPFFTPSAHVAATHVPVAQLPL
jgi:hypothetical protein